MFAHWQVQPYVDHVQLSIKLIQLQAVHRFTGNDVRLFKLSPQQTQLIGTTTVNDLGELSQQSHQIGVTVMVWDQDTRTQVIMLQLIVAALSSELAYEVGCTLQLSVIVNVCHFIIVAAFTIKPVSSMIHQR